LPSAILMQGDEPPLMSAHGCTMHAAHWTRLGDRYKP
jgi:hypothetical protein